MMRALKAQDWGAGALMNAHEQTCGQARHWARGRMNWTPMPRC